MAVVRRAAIKQKRELVLFDFYTVSTKNGPPFDFSNSSVRVIGKIRGGGFFMDTVYFSFAVARAALVRKIDA